MQTRLSSRIQEAMARLEGADPDHGKSTLLVVDDEKGPRESLRMILSPQHRVLLAGDAREALEILRDNDVHAVTVDLNMPGMKGDELMRTIRKQFPQTEVIIITGCSSVETAVDGIRHGIFDYLTKPFDVVEVSNTMRRALARRESRTRLIDFLRGIGEVLGSERDPESAVGELSRSPELKQRLEAALQHSGPPAQEEGSASASVGYVESLAETIESRHPRRRGHSRRVAFLAGLIAERLGLSPAVREEVRVAAFLHDIGRVAARGWDEKRPGELTMEGEADGSHPHAVTGALLSAPLGFPASIALAIRHHHERWDGDGYPDGLAGEDIPLASRIILTADSFDQLTTDHPYRRGLSQSRAIEELRGRAARELDPTILKELIALAESGQSSDGPLLGLRFTSSDDPLDTIASATAWIESDR